MNETSLAPASESRGWLSAPERGTLLGVSIAFKVALVAGRGPGRALCFFIALWYALSDRRAAAASREFLTTALGRPARFRDVFAHMRRFANVALDRIFLLGGRGNFSFTRDGDHHLAELHRERKGAVLIGAHLGSFEAMRLGGEEDEVFINAVGNFSNAPLINAFLDRVSPRNRARVINAEVGAVDFVFEIQERLEQGEMVAILADRVAEGQASVTVEFFGRKARFPTGPFQLAALLKCPVYLTFGIYSEPNHYALSCEPFAEAIRLPRKGREAELQALVQRYAERLEAKARAHPDNWFNFYPFWEDA